ncbi:MAG: NAD(P)-dependent oxidoreductase [Candidatus Hermodarchaeota archaeon]
MSDIYKPKIYFTSNVFSEKEIGSNKKISKEIRSTIRKLWIELNQIAELKFFKGRFPSEDQIREEVENFNPEILGCHLSHQISSHLLENSEIFAVSTSTVGYNHIQRIKRDNILITHTPGVLYKTVADYTIAIIMANLRNLIDLHTYIWNNQWNSKDKWDLDSSLSSVIDNKVLGIIGLGEIGKEIVKRLSSWNIRILYYDLKQMIEFEKKFPLLEFRANIEEVFSESDIVSLHIPLNEYTNNLISRELLRIMKKNALLVNTARGGILDLDALLDMLENKEIKINIALDVFPIEPLDIKTLERFKKIKEVQPDIRMILIPHNASADADTRGRMNIIFLKNIINLVKSTNIEDLRDIDIIPEHKNQLKDKEWRIFNYWEKK